MILRIALFGFLLAGIYLLSGITFRVWGSREEPGNADPVLTGQMTVSEYGRYNHLPAAVLVKVFDISRLSDTTRQAGSFEYEKREVIRKTIVELAAYREEHSKNPIRYTLHFILGLLVMAFVFYRFRTSGITPAGRNTLYLFSVLVFGLGFNASPSPMGPVKDTLSLVGNIPEIIHPRLLAILTYLVTGIIAHKFLCAWVCQLGVLQDLIFRLNRNGADTRGIARQYRIPFVWSNTIRIVFFVGTVAGSFLWALNVTDSINPFAIFGGVSLWWPGWLFAGGIMVMSLFVYRPWCHLFCPFGLLGWFFEKATIFKITVNTTTCTACETCTGVCPTHAMSAILHKQTIRPDCFSCGSCLNACPNGSITFSYHRAR